MSVEDYTPKVIKQVLIDAPKKVTTAARWNELWNLSIEQGDYTAEELKNACLAILAGQTALETHKTADDHPQYFNAARLAAQDYSKTELQTSGQAQVHWDNIINAPNFADNKWKAAVASYATLPVVGNSVDDMRVVVNDGDGKSAMYRCKATVGALADQWEKLADLDWTNDHTKLINLNTDGHIQYHTDARGDARYYTKTLLDAGQLDSRYFTETEVNNLFTTHKNTAVLDHVDGSVTTAKLADNAVTALKISNQSVTGAKLADASITAAKLDPTLVENVVVNTHRAMATIDHPNNSVTEAKLATAVQAKLVPFVAVTGTNAYVATLDPVPAAYTDGMAVAIKIANASTGASTLNVNGLGAKPILDSIGNAITAGGLQAGLIYTLRYNATTGNFIVQGKGGGGNALESQILEGRTATVDGGQITGTMPDQSYAGTGGYNTSGTGKADGLSNLYIQPSISGYYANEVDGDGYGDIMVSDANFIPANLLGGKNYFGIAGAIPVYVDPQAAIDSTVNGTSLYLQPPIGYFDGSLSSYVFLNDPDFIAANILSTANLFGLQGTAIAGKRWASGTATSAGSTITITGLTFTPSIVLLHSPSGGDYEILTNTGFAPTVNVYRINYSSFTGSGSLASGTFSAGLPLNNYSYNWLAIE